MIGMTTFDKPIRGAVAKEMHQHLVEISTAKKQGMVKRAHSPHKTSIKLVEVDE